MANTSHVSPTNAEYQWFHQWRNAAHKLILQKKCKAMIFVIVWKLLNKAKYRFPMDEKKIKDVHNVDKSLKKIGTIRRDLMDNLAGFVFVFSIKFIGELLEM